MLDEVGLNGERIFYAEMSGLDKEEFNKAVAEATAKVKELGASPVK